MRLILITLAALFTVALSVARPASAAPAADRSWPVGGRPRIVHGWDPPASPYGPGHRGVDVAALPDTPVMAAAPGKVVFAGQVAGRGELTITVDGTPLRTTYQPVRALAVQGDRVTAGQVVAVLEHGPFHCSSECLHWGLLRGDTYLDPLSLLPSAMLRLGPSRLLPVFGVRQPAETATPGPARADPLQTPIGSSSPGTPDAVVTVLLAAAAVWTHRAYRSGLSPGRLATPSRRPRRRWRRILRRPEFNTPHRRVHHALKQHCGQPGLCMAELLERLDNHRDQPAVHGSDLLAGAGVELTRGDGHHRPVPLVTDECQLLAHIRLDLALRSVCLVHCNLDLGRPDRKVDGAEFFHHSGARAEVLIDGGARQTGALGEGGKSQRFRTAVGQQRAGSIQQGAALHGPVLGHRGRSNPWHGATLRNHLGPTSRAGTIQLRSPADVSQFGPEL